MVNSIDNEWSNANGCFFKHPFNEEKRHFCEAGVDIPRVDKDNCFIKHPFNKDKREACKLGVDYVKGEKEDSKNCFLRHPFNKNKRKACEDDVEYDSSKGGISLNTNIGGLLGDNTGDLSSVDESDYNDDYDYSDEPKGNTYNTYNQSTPQPKSNNNLGLYVLGGASAIAITMVLIKKFM